MASEVERGWTVQYFINPEFQRDFDAWDHIDNEKIFYIGTTSNALQAIGVEDKNIRWHAAKIIESQNKHVALSNDVMKQVPNILENPVVVMRSKQGSDRLTMFGEVYGTKGAPVVGVLELTPTAPRGYAIESLRLVSTYGKDASLQSFINSSKKLYVDPDIQRVRAWEDRNHIQLEVDPSRYGVLETVQGKTADNNNRLGLQLASRVDAPATTSHFKLDYQNADADDNVDRMREIENLLLSLGLGYSFADFRKWLQD
jgi:hypothetical protein